jgi:hypothetical protein
MGGKDEFGWLVGWNTFGTGFYNDWSWGFGNYWNI